MKFNRLKLAAVAIALLGSSSVFAFGGGDNSDARQCLATAGSGSSYIYTFKNPGWNGKACTKAVRVWACKDNTCGKGTKNSDSSGVVGAGSSFRPGFTPNSTVVEWN